MNAWDTYALKPIQAIHHFLLNKPDCSFIDNNTVLHYNCKVYILHYYLK